ncbi:MAG: hypothetical protein RBS36_04185 [Thiomicrospira sp.]|jgi:tetrahydromethanopterin S-methyltransferase subunit G|nr:hypothetical protein [Thiomicrospira sp.]
MSDLEPRVRLLERTHEESNGTLKALQADFHRTTRTLEKIEQTLEKFAQVFHRFDMVESSIKRAHTRIDSIELKANTTSSDFYSCKAAKLDKTDLKAIDAKLDNVITEVSTIKIAQASEKTKSDWVGRLVWALVSGFIAAGFVYMQTKG